MAIVKVGGGSGLERRVGLKAAKKAAKKSAKHAIEKHAAKKHPAKKHPEKHAGKKAAKKAAIFDISDERTRRDSFEASDKVADRSALLNQAFHHLQRASALISLLEPASGGDLRQLLEHGIELYRAASQGNGEVDGRDVVRCALGLLMAAEHLAMAGLYAARTEFRVRVTPPDADEVRRHLGALAPRLERLRPADRTQAQRLQEMARELLRRAQREGGSDPHLDYELTMAADGLCTALEQGL